MKAILVLNNDKVSDLRVAVRLTDKKWIDRVIYLLEEDKGREAFEILRTKAEVLGYLPKGKKVSGKAEVTLFEDML